MIGQPGIKSNRGERSEPQGGAKRQALQQPATSQNVEALPLLLSGGASASLDSNTPHDHAAKPSGKGHQNCSDTSTKHCQKLLAQPKGC